MAGLAAARRMIAPSGSDRPPRRVGAARRARQQRLVVQLRPARAPVSTRSRVAARPARADVRATRRLSPVMIFSARRARQVAQRLARAGLGRIEEGQEADEASCRARRRGRSGRRSATAAVATRQHADALVRSTRSKRALERPARGGVERGVPSASARADLEHVERALGDRLTRRRPLAPRRSGACARSRRAPRRACSTRRRGRGRARRRIASSSGLGSPVSKRGVAARRARSTRAATAARRRRSAPASCTTPSVSVPVLSVQSTSMLPRFSIALRRRTITPRRAISAAPRARVTLRIAGSSSGLRPDRERQREQQRVDGGPAVARR